MDSTRSDTGGSDGDLIRLRADQFGEFSLVRSLPSRNPSHADAVRYPDISGCPPAPVLTARPGAAALNGPTVLKIRKSSPPPINLRPTEAPYMAAPLPADRYRDGTGAAGTAKAASLCMRASVPAIGAAYGTAGCCCPCRCRRFSAANRIPFFSPASSPYLPERSLHPWIDIDDASRPWKHKVNICCCIKFLQSLQLLSCCRLIPQPTPPLLSKQIQQAFVRPLNHMGAHQFSDSLPASAPASIAAAFYPLLRPLPRSLRLCIRRQSLLSGPPLHWLLSPLRPPPPRCLQILSSQ